MNKVKIKQPPLHYTRWVFYTGDRRLPRYVQADDLPFFVASVYERSGPEFTKHLLIHLN